MTTLAEYEAALAVIESFDPKLDVITPPDLPDRGGPVAFAVDINSVALVVVNWQDFRGWEVRRKASNMRTPLRTLGWVHGAMQNDRPYSSGYIAKRDADDFTDRGRWCNTFGRALAHLLDIA